MVRYFFVWLLDTLTFDQHILFFSEIFKWVFISMLFNFKVALVCWPTKSWQFMASGSFTRLHYSVCGLPLVRLGLLVLSSYFCLFHQDGEQLQTQSFLLLSPQCHTFCSEIDDTCYMLLRCEQPCKSVSYIQIPFCVNRLVIYNKH